MHNELDSQWGFNTDTRWYIGGNLYVEHTADGRIRVFERHGQSVTINDTQLYMLIDFAKVRGLISG